MVTESLAPVSLNIFPLRAVLLPGASLGLRVFEPRYLDLVRECGRSGVGFGVCLILEGEETGAPATSAAFGTEAVIEDFGSDEKGLLTLQVRGVRRFRVQHVRVRDNGRQVADVSWCEPDPAQPLSPEHGLLAVLLQSLLDRFGGEHALAPSALLDDASWVSWRLAELLPLDNAQRLELLQLGDPHQRLERLLSLLP
ncbi:MAG: LON peptidase substrate-binding domain-containing protein [Lysobacter sp.]